jgi:hypothetical protein
MRFSLFVFQRLEANVVKPCGHCGFAFTAGLKADVVLGHVAA